MYIDIYINIYRENDIQPSSILSFNELQTGRTIPRAMAGIRHIECNFFIQIFFKKINSKQITQLYVHNILRNNLDSMYVYICYVYTVYLYDIVSSRLIIICSTLFV